ncbi:MAG TPA: hypothetical protein VN408_27325 [Actinoplanes sp.]|nr:hypothetical protein [Actinoplanes sp.]
MYLNFLDRELGQATEFEITAEALESALKRLILGTAAPLYCGISIIWENTSLGEESRLLLSHLVETDALHPVSYNATVDEFIRSRQRLYQHDAGRYPLYFTDQVDRLRRIVPVVYKADDTTARLEEDLGGWAARSAPDGDAAARRITLRALGSRDSQALTYSYFSPFVQADRHQDGTAEWHVRRQISLGYTDHYLDFADGDIPTGIRGLGYFDAALSRDFPAADVPLLGSLLTDAGLGDLLSEPWQANAQDWDLILRNRGSGEHGRFVRLLRVLITATASVVGGGPPAGQFSVRHRTRSLLRQFALDPEPGTTAGMPVSERLHAAELAAERMAARLGRDVRLAHAIAEAKASQMNERTDVLVVTATAVETRAVLAMASEQWKLTAKPYHIGDKSYWDIGHVAGARVRLTQTEMGSGGPSGSTLTVTEAIRALDPGAVVMVGIAFGIDEDRQRLGDVLVSQQLLAYELQRVGTRGNRQRLVPRGDRVSPSPRLLDRCRTAAVTWRECDVHFGLIVSGDKLVDNLAFRAGLVDLAGGEAQGGEMEGAGLYAAAHRNKVDWIVIKAICDWADGTKEVERTGRQALAARNAANFLSHLLGQGGLV